MFDLSWRRSTTDFASVVVRVQQVGFGLQQHLICRRSIIRPEARANLQDRAGLARSVHLISLERRPPNRHSSSCLAASASEPFDYELQEELRLNRLQKMCIERRELDPLALRRLTPSGQRHDASSCAPPLCRHTSARVIAIRVAAYTMTSGRRWPPRVHSNPLGSGNREGDT